MGRVADALVRLTSPPFTPSAVLTPFKRVRMLPRSMTIVVKTDATSNPRKDAVRHWARCKYASLRRQGGTGRMFIIWGTGDVEEMKGAE